MALEIICTDCDTAVPFIPENGEQLPTVRECEGCGATWELDARQVVMPRA